MTPLTNYDLISHLEMIKYFVKSVKPVDNDIFPYFHKQY